MDYLRKQASDAAAAAQSAAEQAQARTQANLSAAAQAAQAAAKSTAQYTSTLTGGSAGAAPMEEAAGDTDAPPMVDIHAMDRPELERLCGQLQGVHAQMQAS